MAKLTKRVSKPTTSVSGETPSPTWAFQGTVQDEWDKTIERNNIEYDRTCVAAWRKYHAALSALGPIEVGLYGAQLWKEELAISSQYDRDMEAALAASHKANELADKKLTAS